MSETLFEKNLFDVYLFIYFWTFLVLSSNMEEAAFMTYTAASHQGEIKTLLGTCFTIVVVKKEGVTSSSSAWSNGSSRTADLLLLH